MAHLGILGDCEGSCYGFHGRYFEKVISTLEGVGGI